MGLEHGLFYLGCYWVLIALLFFGGLRNLWWLAGLALFVLIEMLTPRRPPPWPLHRWPPDSLGRRLIGTCLYDP